MGGQPVVLALGLAAAALLSLALTVLSSVRRRRHEIALLKALGMTRVQLRAVVAWQTTLTLATLASEPWSKVTFDLEPRGDVVKLTVVHDGFGPDSTVLPGISEGWPRLMSDLKTLLEPGDTLPAG